MSFCCKKAGVFSAVSEIHLQSFSKSWSRSFSTLATRTVAASEAVSLCLHPNVDRQTRNKKFNKPAICLQAVIGALKGMSRRTIEEGDPWRGG